MTHTYPIDWSGKNKAYILDQTQLPDHQVWLEASNAQDMRELIQNMSIRGAPAIGVAGAVGMALHVQRSPSQRRMREAFELLSNARPTAVNLMSRCAKMLQVGEEVLLHVNGVGQASALSNALTLEALRILEEEIESSSAMADHLKPLFDDKNIFMTVCNAGTLAAPGYGTALSYFLKYGRTHRGNLTVYVPETRPLLQGARLTCWELDKALIDHALITDNAAPSLVKNCDAVVVGADRICADGGVLNKVGTYPLALAAKDANVPFVVVAPYSTYDPVHSSFRFSSVLYENLGGAMNGII